MDNYFFYVLHCKDGTLYAGYTTDLEKRLATHNAGKGAKYTQPTKRRPARLIYAEQWDTKSLAMRAEARFKQLTRTQKEHYLHQNGVHHLMPTHVILVDKRTYIQEDGNGTTKFSTT